MLTVGSEVSLWRPLLFNWVLWMRQFLRDVALRVHVDVPQDLINQVAGGLVEVAIMYAPQHRPGLKIDLLMEEELVLATTDPAASGNELDYVHVDWEPDFTLRHDASPAISGWKPFANTWRPVGCISCRMLRGFHIRCMWFIRPTPTRAYWLQP